jgi:dTDP-6-deoxy-L-talose 4-dehydrogenase (NAD+)
MMNLSKNILITGSNGYIGKNLVNYCLSRGKKVVGLSRNSQVECENPNGFFLKMDFSDWDEHDHIKYDQPDSCIHLAWRNGFHHQSTTHYEDLISHLNFIKNIIDLGIKNIAVLGTAHEIGYHNGPVDENTPTRPMNPYGIAKDFLRNAILSYAETKNVKIKWLRVFYIYGDDERNQSVFTKLIHANNQGKLTFDMNSGENLYDFIHIEMLSKQIFMALDQVTGVINCCSGKPVALKSMLEHYIKVNNMNIIPEYGKYPERSYDSKAIWGNPDKINQILNSHESQ